MRLDGVMFGFMSRGSLFLRVDDVNRPAFVAAGMGPFSYERPTRTVSLDGYYETPADVLEDAGALFDWCRSAYRAALMGPPKRKRGGAKAKPAQEVTPASKRAAKPVSEASSKSAPAREAGVEACRQAGVESVAEACAGGGSEAGVEANHQAGIESAPESEADSRSEARVEASHQTGIESVAEACFCTGSQTGIEANYQADVETRSEIPGEAQANIVPAARSESRATFLLSARPSPGDSRDMRRLAQGRPGRDTVTKASSACRTAHPHASQRRPRRL